MPCCLPQHNELSILHWHFGGGGGGDVFLLRGVHWARLIGGRGGGEMRGEIQQGEGLRKGKRRGRVGGRGADRMEHGGGEEEEEEKEGEGSAEPQLHPLMLHVSVARSTARPAEGQKDNQHKHLIRYRRQVSLSEEARWTFFSGFSERHVFQLMFV